MKSPFLWSSRNSRVGGIEYAERRMEEIAAESRVFIDQYVKEKAVKEALTAYLEYVIQRNY